MARLKTTAERGKFKKEIHTALYKNENLRELILGDTSNMSAKELRTAFKDHVKSHLFIDDTIEETTTYIFYDVIFPYIHSNTKSCQVIMYAICHRDILENYSKEGYYGDRSDILAQMIEDTLINDDAVSNSFGIGRLNLDSIEIYNANKFYGCILRFDVPAFR